MAAGSSIGTVFKVTTWGESHGSAVGVVVDGCPAGLSLCEEDVQKVMDRRKPGQSKFTTQRKESDTVSILSGVFEGKTTGTPISMMVLNTDQHSGDYSNIAECYRPGHADYTFDCKYGFRDYRGGGRSSGRETVGRVAAGAVAEKILSELGITCRAYVKSIGPVEIDVDRFDIAEAARNSMGMPDAVAAKEAEEYVDQLMAGSDSAGGVVECVISGLPVGLGEPVFDKMDAKLADAVLSIGAVKGFEIGEGFNAPFLKGSEDNDQFRSDEDGNIYKKTNHSGGVLGGISDGSDIVFRAAIKPTPSIAMQQETVNKYGENIDLVISGRHDPVIAPRAAVVVEAMGAIVTVDMLLLSMTSRLDRIKKFFEEEGENENSDRK